MTALTVADADLAWYIDESLNAMVAIVRELGDVDANSVPDVPDTHSPYAILTHCVGVVEWWGGRMLAGREVQRDRAAEFTASGPVDQLADRVAAARRRLAQDLAIMSPAEPPATPAEPDWADLPMGRTQAGVVMHVVQELSRHHGQLQVLRALLSPPDLPRRG